MARLSSQVMEVLGDSDLVVSYLMFPYTVMARRLENGTDCGFHRVRRLGFDGGTVSEPQTVKRDQMNCEDVAAPQSNICCIIKNFKETGSAAVKKAS